MKRLTGILVVMLALVSCASAKAIYWIDEDGNKAVTRTNNTKHIAELESHIAKYTKEDKDGKKIIVEHRAKQFPVLTKTWSVSDDILLSVRTNEIADPNGSATVK